MNKIKKYVGKGQAMPLNNGGKVLIGGARMGIKDIGNISENNDATAPQDPTLVKTFRDNYHLLPNGIHGGDNFQSTS